MWCLTFAVDNIETGNIGLSDNRVQFFCHDNIQRSVFLLSDNPIFGFSVLDKNGPQTVKPTTEPLQLYPVAPPKPHTPLMTSSFWLIFPTGQNDSFFSFFDTHFRGIHFDFGIHTSLLRNCMEASATKATLLPLRSHSKS